jgi:hypothetical protein
MAAARISMNTKTAHSSINQFRGMRPRTGLTRSRFGRVR